MGPDCAPSNASSHLWRRLRPGSFPASKGRPQRSLTAGSAPHPVALRPMKPPRQSGYGTAASGTVQNMTSAFRTLLVLPLLLIAGGTATADHHERAEPEASTGTGTTAFATDATSMVVAADARAVNAAVQVLRAGGSATDAAIAAQLVLALVEPQSSGIGGGGFLVRRDGTSGAIRTLDGRETAPAGAGPDLFLDAASSPLPFFDAVAGGLSVGVPGLLHMLARAHAEFGKRPWATLFEPALALARDGFVVQPRLHGLLARVPHLERDPDARAYFFDASGKPRPIGYRLRNPKLFETLAQLAADGGLALYRGNLAEAMARKVNLDADRPGTLSTSDFARYSSRFREPVCGQYRTYRVCGMGPPSSGATTVLAILGMLETFDLERMDPGTVEPWHLFAEASRLAYADRDRYVADPDVVRVPTTGLVDPAYLATRARSIDPVAAASGRAAPGNPPGAPGGQRDDRSSGQPSTTHLSIVDGAGNAVALTSSIETAFGSGLMVEGFLLNNQLTDFAFEPEGPGGLVANRVAAGKRPRSSMAPTVVTDADGRLRAVLGSPGGSRIICYVAQAIVLAVDWKLDAASVVGFPHICNRGGPTEIEAETAFASFEQPLSDLGHTVAARPMTSGLNVILVGEDGGLSGAADPRREGTAGIP